VASPSRLWCFTSNHSECLRKWRIPDWVKSVSIFVVRLWGLWRKWHMYACLEMLHLCSDTRNPMSYRCKKAIQERGFEFSITPSSFSLIRVTPGLFIIQPLLAIPKRRGLDGPEFSLRSLSKATSGVGVCAEKGLLNKTYLKWYVLWRWFFDL